MGNDIAERSIRHLKALLAINTTNPPGNESEAVAYVAGVLRRAGVEPVIAEAEPGRGNCIARLKGSGEKSPVLLNAHLDVVPAGKETHWRHPPFGAVEEDGFLWGRGAVDMKHMAAMMLAVAEEVAGAAGKRRGDIVFAWTADEERGGRSGARYIVENHADLLRASYGIGEVGGFPVAMGGESFVVVQTAEKGICWMRLRVRGPSGHGSMPDPGSSVVKLARAVAALGSARLPVHVTRTLELFLGRIASKILPEPLGGVGGALASPHLVGRLLRLMPHSPVVKGLWPMMANTATPTMLEAGESPNVIPEEATAVVDGRFLPGQTREGFLGEIRAVIGEDIELEVIQEAEPLEVEHETEMFGRIEEAVRKFDPRSRVVPYLNPGFTDGKWFSKLGLTWYGFTPLLSPSSQSWNAFELVHATNERVSIEAVKGGSRVLFDLISSWAL
jgi:acetylornithine deacetylase/succinyl-diaminopimelate desuccinylase-like protein